MSGIVLGSAYLLNRPSWVCGKTKHGSVSIWLTLVNLPWLVFAWLVLLAQVRLSKEDDINRIGDSNIWISRYPVFMATEIEFGLVIDLTAEFPCMRKSGSHHLCLPNLDGVRLVNIDIPEQLNQNSKVLVHCAQGHGRSATYTSQLYASLFPEVSPEEAYKIILSNRPGAGVSRDQFEQLSKS